MSGAAVRLYWESDEAKQYKAAFADKKGEKKDA
jgi:hypothetical protein